MPIGFSRLVVRIDGRDQIGVAESDFSVRLLEQMRARGFAAVGAEDLVFGKDESRRAEYLVGGTVREAACLRKPSARVSCRLGVEWQVLDVPRQQVVYSVMSRAAIYDMPEDERVRVSARLVEKTMDSLLRRGAFRGALVSHAGGAGVTDPTFAQATITRCPEGRKIAESADDLLEAVVVIVRPDGHGSGFFVSPEGLVLTAAHVAQGARSKIRFRNGMEVDAVPVRIAPAHDVALLRTVRPLTGQRCTALRTDSPASGTEVYAAGAPENLDLAFSLTRGIVSGSPVFSGQRHLQTDASVNPGNSGGPLADANGDVVGVVSSKLTGTRVEGLGFAVPTADALAALGLRVGDATDRSLLQEALPDVEETHREAFVDGADPIPSLDPEGDARRRAEADALDEPAPETSKDETPAVVPALRWGGVTVGAFGAVVIAATALQYDSRTTKQADFDTLRTWNTVGWIGTAVGVGAFAISFIVGSSSARHAQAPALRVTARGIEWSGAF